MYKLILVIFLISYRSVAGDCLVDERVEEYKTLKVDLDKMFTLIPALKPSDHDFYKEVDENLYSMPEKYRGFLSDKGYVIYSNTKVIETHLFWVNQAIDALAKSDTELEIHAFSRLMLGSIRNVSWLESLSDSNYMFINGIVPKEYADIGKSIAINYASIALCMANHFEALVVSR